MEKVKKNFIYNVLYQLLVLLMPLITTPYISRTLGSTAVGIYSYTNSIAYYFLLIAMLGISNYGNRCIASLRDKKNEMNKTFLEIYTIQIISYLISIISYIIYVFFITDKNQNILIIQLIYVASGMIDISWLFFGLEEFKITVTKNIIIKLITVISIFIVVSEPSDLWKYTLIMSLGTFISQVYMWFYVRRYIHFEKVKFKEIKKHISQILILFVPIIAYSIYKIMDKIMLGNMSTYDQVAYYQSSEKIVNIPLGIITALGTVMLPRMSNIISKEKNEKIYKYIHTSMKLVTLIGSALAFGIIGVNKILVPIYFGKEFLACSSIMSLLSITIFPISWSNVIRTQYLIPSRNDKIYVLSTTIGAILNLIINFLLIPKYGANGAAIGTIVAEFSVFIIQSISVTKKMPIIKYVLSCIPQLLIGFFMMIVVYLEGKILCISITTLIFQIVTGGLIYIISTCTYLYLSKDEINKLFFLNLKKIIKV